MTIYTKLFTPSLTEDYVLDRLSPSKRQMFERNLLNRADLRNKVRLTKLLLRYLDAEATATSQSAAISQYQTRRSNYEGSTESKQFLRLGLGIYQTCLWISAVFRLVLLGLLCFLVYLVSFTEATGIFPLL